MTFTRKDLLKSFSKQFRIDSRGRLTIAVSEDLSDALRDISRLKLQVAALNSATAATWYPEVCLDFGNPGPATGQGYDFGSSSVEPSEMGFNFGND